MNHHVLLLIACILTPAAVTAATYTVPPSYALFNINTMPAACAPLNSASLNVGFDSKYFSDYGLSYASNSVHLFSLALQSAPFINQNPNPMITQVQVNNLSYPVAQFPISSNMVSNILPVFNGDLVWNFGIKSQTYSLRLMTGQDIFLLSTAITPRTNSFSSLNVSLSNPTTFQTGCFTFNFTSPCAYLPTSTILQINIPPLFTNKGSYMLSAFDVFEDAVCDVALQGYARPTGLRCTKTNDSLYVYNLFENTYTASSGSVKICNLRTTFGALASPMRIRLLSDSSLSTDAIFVSNTQLLQTTNPTINFSSISLARSSLDNKWSLSFSLSHPASFIMLQANKVEVKFSSYCFNTSQVNVSMLHQDDTSSVTYTSPVSSVSSVISYALQADLKLDKGGVMTINGINKPSSSVLSATVVLRDKFNRVLSQQSTLNLTFPSA
jgi:hypothetical protein